MQDIDNNLSNFDQQFNWVSDDKRQRALKTQIITLN